MSTARLKALLMSASLILLSVSPGQGQGNDGCADVLALTGRDELYSYERQEAMREIYDQYCSGKQMKSGVNLDLGVEDLLGGFNLGVGTTKDKVESVCREYEDIARRAQSSLQQASIVVKEAIAAWRDCKQIAANGLDIDPKVQHTQFAIDFRRWGARDVVLNGFNYDARFAECRGATTAGEDQVLDRTSKVLLTDDTSWSAVCRRHPKEIGSITYYPEVEVIVPTSANGTFTLRVPRSVLPELTWSQQIGERIDNLEKENREKAQNLDQRLKQQRPVESISCRLTGPEWLNGFDGRLDAQCGPDEFLHGLFSDHNDEYEDRAFRFYCCKLRLKAES